MNRYETVFILTPVLSEQQVEEAVNKFLEEIKSCGGTISHTENWGLKKLAYSIDLKKNGFYHLVEFDAPGETVHKLELAFKRDERILRYMTLKMDKHAQDWAQERKVRISKVK
ncbi:MAG: 30S ribosomal protein S6 [Flavobacteriaceae bacterium]|nr:MAG: 30S ribosomal protein S6 [Flavobacteriaceae bacterium]